MQMQFKDEAHSNPYPPHLCVFLLCVIFAVGFAIDIGVGFEVGDFLLNIMFEFNRS